MFPAKNRRNITVEGVLWYYRIGYEGIVAQNTETNELIEWNAGFELQITPALVKEVILSKGKPEGFNIPKTKKFITTTLPYANSVPHIGHAFEFILGDAISRYFRNKLGDSNVHFNVGLDEHGEKIFNSAIAAGKTTKEFLDELAFKWKEFCQSFNIDFNTFYRTSHTSHEKKVSDFWTMCKNKGLIYKQHYSGSYCVGCECFKLEKDLVDGSCQDHPSLEIKQVDEENYFFALSKFRKKLLNWIDTEIDIRPEIKKIELRKFVDEIRDISISRTRESVPWGIIVPGDSEQVVYVWFDALLNYIFVSGYGKDESEFKEYWSNSVQIFGPDNLKFQAAIFQCLLYAADIENTKTLLCHGTIVDKHGKKMSKTTGNVVDPIDQLEKFGIDAVRYFALSGLNLYDISSWDETEVINRYNAYLADKYGNLLTRVVHLASKRADWDIYSNWNRDLFSNKFIEVESLWDNYEVDKAIHKIEDIIREANNYITVNEPWKVEDEKSLEVLVTLFWCLKDVTRLYAPVMPGKAKEALESLHSLKKIILFPKIEIDKTVTKNK